MSVVYHVQLPLFPSKECALCHLEKSPDDFYKSATGKDGYENRCKQCQYLAEKAREEAKHPSKVIRARRSPKQQAAQSNEAKRDKQRAACHAYHLANLEKERARRRAYYAANRERIREELNAKNRILAAKKQARQPIIFIREGYKICANCKGEKLFNEFYRCRTASDGYHYSCKECRDKASGYKEIGKVRNRRNRLITPGHKWCHTCQQEKPLDYFTCDRTHKDGHASKCKDCSKAASLSYYQSHRERLMVYMRTKYASLHQRSKKSKHPYPIPLPPSTFSKLAYNYAYYTAHREQILIQKREYLRANRMRYREIAMRRSARKRGATIGKVSYAQILERDGRFCHICEKDILSHHILHFDHVIPLARGGNHTEDNIKPSHNVCNMRKGKRLLSEMMPFLRRGVE
jgi:hypothetical protein